MGERGWWHLLWGREKKSIHNFKNGKTAPLLRAPQCSCGIPLPLPHQKTSKQANRRSTIRNLVYVHGLATDTQTAKKCLASTQTRIVNSYFSAASNQLHSKGTVCLCLTHRDFDCICGEPVTEFAAAKNLIESLF